MSARKFILGLVLALVVHLTAARLVPGFPRWVDIFLVLVVLNGLPGKSLPGMLGGLVGGLTCDALSGGLFGLYGFANTLTGYGTALVARRLVTQRAVGVLAVFVLAAAFQRATLFSLDWFLQSGTALPSLPWALLPIATSSVLGTILHGTLGRLQKRFQERRWRRASGLQGKG